MSTCVDKLGRPFADHTGKRFGKLIAVKPSLERLRGSVMWECSCDCGKTKLVPSRNLVKGETVSCGCKRTSTGVLKVGQKFNRLTVVEIVGFSAKQHNYLFKFKCDCGTEKIIQGALVKRGLVKSCGCFRKQFIWEVRKNLSGHDGKAAYRYFYKSYKCSAVQKELEFSLSFEDYEKLASSNCRYCGSPPRTTLRKKYTDIAVNGIDRADCMKGYTHDNVVPCCTVCNIAKSTMTTHQFLDWIKRVYEFNKMAISS